MRFVCARNWAPSQCFRDDDISCDASCGSPAFEFNSKKTMYIWSNLMDETNLWMCYSVWILRRFNVKRWIGIIILKWFLEPFCSLDFQQCHIFSEAPELETNEDFRRCRSEHFPNAHISHNSQQCGSIVSSKCGTHFNLATICNLYDNVHFDVELAVNTCKTITATISKCAGKTFRFPFAIWTNVIVIVIGDVLLDVPSMVQAPIKRAWKSNK